MSGEGEQLPELRLSVLGGTGSFGQALVERIAARGKHEVVIGSRDASRARASAERFKSELVGGTSNEGAVFGADLVVLAVRADAALETARSIAPLLTQPLFSVASNLSFVKGVGVLPDPDSRSLAERIQDVVSVPVVAGLHSVAAASLTSSEPSQEDALVCGDDEQAKSLGLAFAQTLVNGRALDAGPLASARALEGMTAVIINLNRRYRTHAGITVSGIPAGQGPARSGHP